MRPAVRRWPGLRELPRMPAAFDIVEPATSTGRRYGSRPLFMGAGYPVAAYPMGLFPRFLGGCPASQRRATDRTNWSGPWPRVSSTNSCVSWFASVDASREGGFCGNVKDVSMRGACCTNVLPAVQPLQPDQATSCMIRVPGNRAGDREPVCRRLSQVTVAQPVRQASLLRLSLAVGPAVEWKRS